MPKAGGEANAEADEKEPEGKELDLATVNTEVEEFKKVCEGL
jgi:hypothetical protein